MIGLRIDVKGLVVWFSIRPVSACAKVQGNVEEVCLYKVFINSDFKLMVLKKIVSLFSSLFWRLGPKRYEEWQGRHLGTGRQPLYQKS